MSMLERAVHNGARDEFLGHLCADALLGVVAGLVLRQELYHTSSKPSKLSGFATLTRCKLCRLHLFDSILFFSSGACVQYRY